MQLSESGGTTIGRTLVTLLLLYVLAGLPAVAAIDGTHSAGMREFTAADKGSQQAGTGALRHDAARRFLKHRVAKAEARRRYWLRVMHRPLPPRPRLAGLALSELARAAELRLRHVRALARAARRPPHLAGWRCIQQHETAPPYPGWRTDSGNGYYGGLQFDRDFQLTYGSWLYRSKGTAENWTWLEQVWTAEFAHATGRGFGPWPNTARVCGLL